MGCLVVDVGGVDVCVSEVCLVDYASERPAISGSSFDHRRRGPSAERLVLRSVPASFDDRVEGGRSRKRRDGPGARHVARRVAGRLGREAGHSVRVLEGVDGGGSPERRDGPGARHVARRVAGRLGREAGHSVRVLEGVDGGGSPERRDGPGARRVAEPGGGGGLRRPPVGLVLGWRDVAERGVQPVVVEPADPFDDRELGLLVGAPDAV